MDAVREAEKGNDPRLVLRAAAGEDGGETDRQQKDIMTGMTGIRRGDGPDTPFGSSYCKVTPDEKCLEPRKAI